MQDSPKNSFSHPQRQSLVGVVLMFADTIQQTARALWPILIVWILRIDEMNKIYLLATAIAVFVLVSIIAYLKYRNFTFFLDEENEEFIVNTGIINKSRLAIPLDKIQQVNINQSLIQKFIGVHELQVDTAGSSEKEVSIKAITHELASELKTRLLEGSKNSTKQVLEADSAKTLNQEESTPFIKISLASLFKTGITSNYARSFALLFAFFITVFQYVEDFVEATGYEDDPFDTINTELVLKFFVLIILFIVVLTLLVNLSRTILKYYNYQITKQQNGLLLSFGLLNTRNTIIKPERVQSVIVGGNFFQKKMNINDLKVRQASHLQTTSKEQQKSAIEIPGCSNSETNALLKILLEQIPERGVMLKPNFRKLLMKVIFTLIIPFGIYFSLAYTVASDLKEYFILLPFYVIFVLLIIAFGFRNYRLFVNDEFIIKQSGAWDVDVEYLAPHKIQTISLTQYFWHKSLNIGIVTIHTAAGALSFGLADYSRLKQFVNYWLYQVETTNKNWM
jgi:putative membrane protein